MILLMISLMNYCKGCPESVYPVEIPNPSKPTAPKEIFIDSNNEDFLIFVENNPDGFIVISYQDAKSLLVYLTELVGKDGYIEKLLFLIDYYKPNYEEVNNE